MFNVSIKIKTKFRIIISAMVTITVCVTLKIGITSEFWAIAKILEHRS